MQGRLLGALKGAFSGAHWDSLSTHFQIVMKFQKCIFFVLIFYEGFKLFDNIFEIRVFDNFLVDF